MWFDTDYTATECTCSEHAGRELRVWTGSPVHDSLVESANARHFAAMNAAVLPFAFAANQGIVLADRIERA